MMVGDLLLSLGRHSALSVWNLVSWEVQAGGIRHWLFLHIIVEKLGDVGAGWI